MKRTKILPIALSLALAFGACSDGGSSDNGGGNSALDACKNQNFPCITRFANGQLQANAVNASETYRNEVQAAALARSAPRHIENYGDINNSNKWVLGVSSGTVSWPCYNNLDIQAGLTATQNAQMSLENEK